LGDDSLDFYETLDTSKPGIIARKTRERFGSPYGITEIYRMETTRNVHRLEKFLVDSFPTGAYFDTDHTSYVEKTRVHKRYMTIVKNGETRRIPLPLGYSTPSVSVILPPSHTLLDISKAHPSITHSQYQVQAPFHGFQINTQPPASFRPPQNFQSHIDPPRIPPPNFNSFQRERKGR